METKDKQNRITEWPSPNGEIKLQYIPLFDHYRFCTRTQAGGWIVGRFRYPARKWTLASLLKTVNQNCYQS